MLSSQAQNRFRGTGTSIAQSSRAGPVSNIWQEPENYCQCSWSMESWNRSHVQMAVYRGIVTAQMSLLRQRMTETYERFSGQSRGENIGMTNTRETNTCPVCGQKELEYMEICPVCEWQNDTAQLRHPDWDGCANNMSLNEAREAYKKGKKIR